MTDPMRSKFSRKAKKRGQIEEVYQFVKLRYHMLNLSAWLSLRPATIKVYNAIFGVGYNQVIPNDQELCLKKPRQVTVNGNF